MIFKWRKYMVFGGPRKVKELKSDVHEEYSMQMIIFFKAN